MKLTQGLILLSMVMTSTAVSAGEIKPLAMTQKAIGGGDIAGTPTKGIQGGKGLYNIGLLVKSWGKVTYRDPNGKYFYIDDGSAMWDGTTISGKNILGVRVSIENLATGNSITMPDTNTTYVSVVGVVSTFVDGQGKVRPMLRPRNEPDVVPVVFAR
jgi:hypothetical protein